MKPTVVIIGANGFLGRYLCRHHTRLGREVVAIARNREGWNGDGMFLPWNGKTTGPWAYALEGAAMVVNLSGRSVNCRYDAGNRREILESRILTTRVIGEAIAACRMPPALWVNASTATWYRHAEDGPQDEWTGEPGTGFSHQIAAAWEHEFFSLKTPPETRKIAIRTGMVLANEPGTVYDVLASLTHRALGGTMGNGNQRISWIHMDDFLRSLDFIMKNPFLDGIFNITAPDFPTNRELMRLFRSAGGMPLGLPASRWMLAFGAAIMRTETELILKSRWADPLRLKQEGFRWRYPTADHAIPNLAARRGLDAFFNSIGRRSTGARAWLPAMTR